MGAKVRISRRMTRKDGNAKATIASKVKVSTSPSKTTVSASRKVVPKNVKSN